MGGSIRDHRGIAQQARSGAGGGAGGALCPQQIPARVTLTQAAGGGIGVPTVADLGRVDAVGVAHTHTHTHNEGQRGTIKRQGLVSY